VKLVGGAAMHPVVWRKTRSPIPKRVRRKGGCLLAVIRRTPRAAFEALGGVEVSCHSQRVRALSDESRGGLEGRRHMATEDKGRSKSKEDPRKDPQTEASDQEGEASGRDCEVVRRLRVDDAARAARAAPQGSRHVRVVAIRVLGSSGFT